MGMIDTPFSVSDIQYYLFIIILQVTPCPAYTTMFTNRLGTTITFRTVFPVM